jgi:hypothetical protein
MLLEAREGVDPSNSRQICSPCASGRPKFFKLGSGDFYDSPRDLYEERPTRLPWLPRSNDLGALRDAFAVELAWIEARHDRRPGPSRLYPDTNIRMAWNAKAYVELALQNVDHFGWHNIERYCRHHAEALQLAYDAHGRDDETFRRALYTNAFADHFLTDAFSAGHIRVPRAEIIAWARSEGLSDRLAGALSKLLHDQDGHVDLDSLHDATEGQRSDNDGLLVRNARGKTWHARCDGQLFLDPGSAELPAVGAPVTAVAASVTELLLAWTRGELPKGVYRATEHVPFPHPTAPKLIEKFPANLLTAACEALHKSIAWYARLPWICGVEVDDIRRLFRALPDIMAHFRATVAAAADRDPLFATRVAPSYVAAFREIA